MPRILKNDLIGLVTAISISMLIGSYATRDNWWGDLLLQIGSAALVVVPFLYLARVIEHRLNQQSEQSSDALESARRAVANLSERFEQEQFANRERMARTSADIGAIVAKRLNDEHSIDRALFRGVAEAPSRRDVVEALHRAAKLKIIASFGVRVPLGSGVYLWLRPRLELSHDDDPLPVVIQKWNLVPAFSDEWKTNESVIEFMHRIGVQLRRTELWTGDASFRPQQALDTLAAYLHQGHEAHISGDSNYCSKIFEMVESDWIVAEDALLHFTRPDTYAISYSQFNQTHWVDHMHEKEWVNRYNFQMALDVAICLVADGIAEGQPPKYLPGVWQNRAAVRSTTADDAS